MVFWYIVNENIFHLQLEMRITERKVVAELRRHSYKLTSQRQAVIRAILWLTQNTYSAENTFFLEAPQNAIGGIFWNSENRYVRTDSLCHGLNAYIVVVKDWDDGLILSVPEEPFHITLDMLRN